jgi:hypothetical protein
MKSAIEMPSCGMIYVTSFVKMGTDVEAVLRFHLRYLRAFDVGITDGGIYGVLC